MGDAYSSLNKWGAVYFKTNKWGGIYLILSKWSRILEESESESKRAKIMSEMAETWLDQARGPF